jgi:MFS family permease
LLIAGVIGPTAPTFGFLLLSRALIGVGTSAAYPAAMALVRQRADSAGLGIPSPVLGNFSIVSRVTAVIGLPLGGGNLSHLPSSHARRSAPCMHLRRAKSLWTRRRDSGRET